MNSGASRASRRPGLPRRAGRAGLAAFAAVALAPAAAAAQIQLADATDLNSLSLEELANIEVTSVSKRAEPVATAASSIYVITGEELRQTGVQSLVDALRLAPNLEVARIDALDYSITARGFGGFEAANKLLVMIDGRSIYTPLYSGVDWDEHQVMVDDVDRIEVISGPGGALWGANAVNGVISIESKSADETQGLLIAADGGSLDSNVRARYGGRLGASGAFRVYAMAFQRGDSETAQGVDAEDGWSGAQGGFRIDLGRDDNRVTLVGDAHRSDFDPALKALDGYVQGGDLMARWRRRSEAGGQFELQAYVDRSERLARLVYDSLDTFDVSLQHTLAPAGAHQIVWGAGFRRTSDDFHLFDGSPLLDPPRRRITVSDLFVQDQIALTDAVTFTAGLKLEDNSFTKAELMPSARLAWRVARDQLVWAAVSRAIRNPSRIERDFAVPGVVEPHLFEAETVVAYEAGYRGRPTARTTLSLSLFYNDYGHLRTNDLTPPGIYPGHVGNSMRGATYGVEVWGDVDLAPWWRLSAGLVRLEKDFKVDPGSFDNSGMEGGGADPPYWVKLRSLMRLSDTVDLDLRLRAYGKTPQLAASGYLGAPAYAEADARIAWRVRPDLELALTGQNLLHARHVEASEDRRYEVPRSAFVSLRWTR